MRPQKLSLGHCLCIGMIGSLLLVAIVAIVVHDRHRNCMRRVEQAKQVRLITEGLIAMCSGTDEVTTAQLRRAGHLLVGNSGVLAVRFWDGSGTVLADASAYDHHLEYLESPPSQGPTQLSVSAVREMRDGTSHPLQRVDLGLGIHQASRTPVRASLLFPDHTMIRPIDQKFAIIVLLAAVIPSILLTWHVNRNVTRPLTTLTSTVSNAEFYSASTKLAHRGDAWGALARRIHQLQHEVMLSREKADHTERRVTRQITSQIGQVVQNLRRLQRESQIDPLTGVQNRRMLEEKLPVVFEEQRKAREDLSIVMIDLDHFKTLNDAAGHQAGDGVLRVAGDVLKQCVRSSDLIVRYGGDEFVLILPGVDVKSAFMLTQRISRMFSQRIKMMNFSQPLPTMTAGIASLKYNRSNRPDDLLASADHALYRAKQTGRGRALVCPTNYHHPDEATAPKAPGARPPAGTASREKHLTGQGVKSNLSPSRKISTVGPKKIG